MARKGTSPLITDFDNIPDEALVPVEEQPYSIPEHWKWVRFKSLNRFKSKTMDPSKFPESQFYLFSVPAFPEGSPEYICGNKIGSAKQQVNANDVLVCKINPRINRVWVVNLDESNTIASSEWIVFRPSYGDSDFFRAYFSSGEFRQLLCSELSGVGGSLTRARPKLVDEYPIPLPPLDEQLRIVEKLDAHLAQTNSAIAEAERFLAGFESYRNSLVQAGVSGQLTAQWRAQNGIKREDWTRSTLGKAFKWSSGGTPSRKRPEFFKGDIPWVKSGELCNGTILDTEEHISKEALVQSSAKLFPTGTVLIAMYGATIGKVGILATAAATNQAVAAAFKAEHSRARYLVYFLRANREKFIALGKGGAQPNISQTLIKAFPFDRPILTEQDEIVRLLDSKLESLNQAETLVQKSLATLNALRDSLVSAALSGRLT